MKQGQPVVSTGFAREAMAGPCMGAYNPLLCTTAARLLPSRGGILGGNLEGLWLERVLGGKQVGAACCGRNENMLCCVLMCTPQIPANDQPRFLEVAPDARELPSVPTADRSSARARTSARAHSITKPRYMHAHNSTYTLTNPRTHACTCPHTPRATNKKTSPSATHN